MPETTIPDEAVEAAANAIYDKDLGYRVNMSEAEAFAKVALEAAAPHLMAAAWDEGHDAGWDNATRHRHADRIPNPYRPAGEGE